MDETHIATYVNTLNSSTYTDAPLMNSTTVTAERNLEAAVYT